MHPVTVHLISGDLFFTGAVLFLIGCLLPRPPIKGPGDQEEPPPRHERLLGASGRLGDLILVLGIGLQAVGSMPLPRLYPWLLGGLVVVYLGYRRWRNPGMAPWGVALRSVMGLLCAVAVLTMLSQRRLPQVPWAAQEPLHVIGDSLSAGLDDGEVTWPELLSRATGRPVVNLAAAGATVRTAMHQADELPEEAFVILEIGGNDLLGESTAAQFEEGLGALLERVATPRRRVVMFELPLPPLRGEFARIQHRLAVQHDVMLIPRPLLARVFLGSDTTTDGLHLSPAGQEKLAEAVLPVFLLVDTHD